MNNVILWPGPPHYRGLTITLRHTTLGRNSLEEWSARTKWPLPDNTRHSQETDIYFLCGIRNSTSSQRAATDPRFRPHGQWDRHV